MIKIYKGLEDYNELQITMRGVNDINSLVELISDSNKYEITNDLREQGMVDMNYKSICVTIEQVHNKLVIHKDIEVWDDEGKLDFVLVDMLAYSQYQTTILDDGMVKVFAPHPYDEQEYYYVVGNKVYRNGKYIETIVDKHDIDGIDVMILRLIELNATLEPRICHN